MISRNLLMAATLALAATVPTVTTSARPAQIDPAQDVFYLGPPAPLLFLTPEQRTARFRNMAIASLTRPIKTGRHTLRLPVQPADFDSFRYTVDDREFGLDDFVDHNGVVGLLIIKDGIIRKELYTSGNDEESLWISFSVAKSVVSMLIGAAIRDGYIRSVDEKVTDYLPRLKGSSYDDVSIKNVLQMASGVAWDETYDDPDSDVNTTPGDYLGLVRTLAEKERVAAPGEKFNYNTGETNLVGAILRAAIGNNLAAYLTEKIWQPFGMEHDANWLLDGPNGGELGGCCISASLRDYGRLGLFALGDGKLADGSAVLTDGWMRDSTSPSAGADYYGYLWWLLGPDAFAAIGIYGQTIAVNRAENQVIVTHGAWDTAVGQEYSAHRRAFIAAVTAYLE